MSENEHQTTIANADLWARYFHKEWSRWTDPLGLSQPANQIAQGTGARVANLLTLVAAGPFAWLYGSSYQPITGTHGDESAASVETLEEEHAA